MKRYITILTLTLCVAVTGYAQNGYEHILSEIEKNNTTLQALRRQAEALKLENETGIYLDNPEVELKRMFEGSSDEGALTEISVKQSFDFPSAYSHRSKIADGRNLVVDMEYQQSRKDILLEATMLCVNLTYRNILKKELEKRFAHAKGIADATRVRFNSGETDILERNKARLSLLSARKASEANEVERGAILSELARLNGGNSISAEPQSYFAYQLPSNFDEWFQRIKANNPILLAAAYNIELSKKQVKLNKAMSLPKLSAGYINERVGGNTRHGLSVGISVPLWQNKNTVKSAKIQTKALESAEVDTRLQFYNTLKLRYEKALGLHNLIDDYKKILSTINSDELLKKALDNGKLSLLSYLMELSIYYDAIDALLEAERDYQYAISELMQWNS
ncbi:MAG: TolC family protein [Prevotellaceae bacterium]|jgi:outer membrane protein TolC|nr:TolC family protein [Prevotellaceae bacterium]